jgi:hypothetical protein
VNSEIHFEAMIERVWRCNWRPRLSQLRDALGGRDRVSLEMHWEAVINASLEMHFEAVMERDWRCTGRL